MNRIVLVCCLLLSLCVGCKSEEDIIKENALETAHEWLKWKYDPMGSIIYTDEWVVPTKDAYGDWSVSYSAQISCVSRPFPQSRPDSVTSVSGRVFLDMEYRYAESRFVITNSILP